MIAAGLLLATLATFDRCLGRMRSFGREAPPGGEGKNRAVAACYFSSATADEARRLVAMARK